jgi:hypothetical protein
VALRFQDERDEADRVAKESRPVLILVFLIAAAIHGVSAWVRGPKSPFIRGRHSMGIPVLFYALDSGSGLRTVSHPTKEIYGTVTEIEKAISEVKEDQKELLERPNAIEEEMRSLR